MKTSPTLPAALLIGLAGCTSQQTSTPDPVVAPQNEAGVDAVDAPDDAVDGATVGAVDADPNVLWQEGDCAHPLVEERCENGWCSIPAGCFIIGSPEGEYERGMYTENLTPVTLTHAFQIGQHEVTQQEWTSLGLKNPSVTESQCEDCGFDGAEPTSPVGNVTWIEAAAFANLASEKHDPPLPACYVLEGCTSSPGEGMTCTTVKQATPSLYECRGFRLPTEFEWEYAVRAGTRTANYNGGFAPETTYADAFSCDGEPTLSPIAWYCANSGSHTHPVGQRKANGWGIHDALGNAAEWVHDHMKNAGYGLVPLVDPEGAFVETDERVIRGGPCFAWPAILRAAGHAGEHWWNRSATVGFRLARSGADNPGPLVKVTTTSRKARPTSKAKK